MNIITIAEMIQEIQRELEIRRKVFPRWIQDGKLN